MIFFVSVVYWRDLDVCLLALDDARGKDPFDPRRVLPYGRGEEGLDLTSSLKAKFGARSNQAHQIRGKALGSNVTTRRKSWYEITILGAFGVMSETKFGVFVTYILDAKFGTKAPGSDPLAPRPLIWSLKRYGLLQTYRGPQSTSDVCPRFLIC